MKAVSLYILLLICAFCTQAQNNACGKIWKKEVSRIIYIKAINERLHNQNNKEKTLLAIIIAAVKAGKINVYNARLLTYSYKVVLI